MMNSLISETNDALLHAQGYANGAQLILRALQDQPHGPQIDDGLYSLELVVSGVLVTVQDALGSLEMLNHITPADQDAPVGNGDKP